MMKNFLPKVCPSCGQKLIIERGDKESTMKLMCNNIDCCGVLLRKLEKGIIALKIRDIGPSTIEKLMVAGINSSLDLFNDEKFNEEILILSGEFKKGRSLEKLIESVKNVKEIPIQNLILSLQIDGIGETFSEKIGKKLSGLNVDYSGHEISIREQLDIKDSDLNKTIYNAIRKIEELGICVVRFEAKKQTVITKTINKVVNYSNINKEEIQSIIEKNNWEFDEDIKKCTLFIIPDKNYTDERVEFAKDNDIKIMTLQQIKILFK